MLHLIAADPDAHGTRIPPELSELDWRVLAEVCTEELRTVEIARELDRRLSETRRSLATLRERGLARRVDGSHRYTATADGRVRMRLRLAGGARGRAGGRAGSGPLASEDAATERREVRASFDALLALAEDPDDA